jgi:hypothetical protein
MSDTKVSQRVTVAGRRRLARASRLWVARRMARGSVVWAAWTDVATIALSPDEVASH